MCNHEDRPCCGCLAEDRATDYYAGDYNDDMFDYGYENDRYGDDIDPEDCEHMSLNRVTEYVDGTIEGTCDWCESPVRFSGEGDTYTAVAI